MKKPKRLYIPPYKHLLGNKVKYLTPWVDLHFYNCCVTRLDYKKGVTVIGDCVWKDHIYPNSKALCFDYDKYKKAGKIKSYYLKFRFAVDCIGREFIVGVDVPKVIHAPFKIKEGVNK